MSSDDGGPENASIFQATKEAFKGKLEAVAKARGKNDIKIEEVMMEPKVKEILRPASDLVAAYDDAYRIYRDAYPNIKVLK